MYIPLQTFVTELGCRKARVPPRYLINHDPFPPIILALGLLIRCWFSNPCFFMITSFRIPLYNFQKSNWWYNTFLSKICTRQGPYSCHEFCYWHISVIYFWYICLIIMWGNVKNYYFSFISCTRVYRPKVSLQLYIQTYL